MDFRFIKAFLAGTALASVVLLLAWFGGAKFFEPSMALPAVIAGAVFFLPIVGEFS